MGSRSNKIAIAEARRPWWRRLAGQRACALNAILR